MTELTHILIVDDDKEIRNLLASFLKQYNFAITTAADGEQMLEQLEANKFDLIILDLMLPGDDGLTLCKKVRSQSQIPIIMATAMGEETDRIIGLEMGADDYIAKPFNPREILARIKAVLRRTESIAADSSVTVTEEMSQKVEFNSWQLDLATRQLVSPDNLEITISSGEYDLLVAFIEHPRRVLSRDQLLDITKNREAGPFDRSIDVQISRLRHKIEPDPKTPSLIKTVRGGGYLFTADVSKL